MLEFLCLILSLDRTVRILGIGKEKAKLKLQEELVEERKLEEAEEAEGAEGAEEAGAEL